MDGLTYFMNRMGEGELERLVGQRKSFYLENIVDYDAPVAQVRRGVVALGLTWGRRPDSKFVWNVPNVLEVLAQPGSILILWVFAIFRVTYGRSAEAHINALGGAKDPDVVIERNGDSAMAVHFVDRIAEGASPGVQQR